MRWKDKLEKKVKKVMSVLYGVKLRMIGMRNIENGLKKIVDDEMEIEINWREKKKEEIM